MPDVNIIGVQCVFLISLEEFSVPARTVGAARRAGASYAEDIVVRRTFEAGACRYVKVVYDGMTSRDRGVVKE